MSSGGEAAQTEEEAEEIKGEVAVQEDEAAEIVGVEEEGEDEHLDLRSNITACNDKELISRYDDICPPKSVCTKEKN